MDTFSLPFQEMLEQMPDSVIYADTEGKIRFWNAASEQMFGFTAQEALGQSLDIIIPEYLREPHWRGFYAAVESGRTKHNGRATRTKALHRDGHYIYAQVSFCLIKNAQGQVLGSLSSARPTD